MTAFDLFLDTMLIFGTIGWVAAHRRGLLFDFWLDHCRPRKREDDRHPLD